MCGRSIKAESCTESHFLPCLFSLKFGHFKFCFTIGTINILFSFTIISSKILLIEQPYRLLCRSLNTAMANSLSYSHLFIWCWTEAQAGQWFFQKRWKTFIHVHVCISQWKGSHFLFVYCTIEHLCGSQQFLFSCADWFLLLYFEEMCLRDTNVRVIEKLWGEWTFQ